jgi:hypothetical protein
LPCSFLLKAIRNGHAIQNRIAKPATEPTTMPAFALDVRADLGRITERGASGSDTSR